MAYHLAQLNLARLRHPLDADETAEFVAALEPVNAIAEATPGFVWRLTDESGQSSASVVVAEIDDPLVIVNYSIWADLESFRHYVYKSGHSSYLRRRRDWFEPMDEAAVVCWWTPAGTVPPVADALARLEGLRTDGPSPRGWPLGSPMDPPDRG